MNMRIAAIISMMMPMYCCMYSLRRVMPASAASCRVAKRPMAISMAPMAKIYFMTAAWLIQPAAPITTNVSPMVAMVGGMVVLFIGGGYSPSAMTKISSSSVFM